jgi:hypothetical protein
VPFSETSVHQSKVELWPIFLLEQAYWIIRPLTTLIVYSLKKDVGIDKFREAKKELGYHNLYADQVQIRKLEQILCK